MLDKLRQESDEKQQCTEEQMIHSITTITKEDDSFFIHVKITITRI